MTAENAVYFFTNIVESKKNLPDAYIFDESSNVVSPRSNFVMSRNVDGSALSYYHDKEWDFSPYSPTRGVRLHFGAVESEIHRAEIKRLLFALLVLSSGRGDAMLSPKTIYDYFQSCLLPMADEAFSQSCSIKEFLEDGKRVDKYAKMLIKKTDYRLLGLRRLLDFLMSSNNIHTGIKYKKDDRLMSNIVKNINALSSQQTPVIPVEIFANATRQRWESFNDAYALRENLAKFLEKIADNPLYARPLPRPGKKTVTLNNNERLSVENKDYKSWNDAVEECGIKDLFLKYNVKGRANYTRYFSALFLTCKHLIHSYTGMRSGEAILLRHGCISELKNGRVTQIIGITTKLHGVPTETNWVTVPEIKKVVSFLEYIGNTVIDAHDIVVEDRPLFVGMGVMRKGRKRYKTEGKKLIASFNGKKELPLSPLRITITEDHIEELESVMPERDWRNDKQFGLGKVWKFKPHQYRRSLAVYALNSGIVSIYALKKQFAHLFVDMTAYYGRGASNAKKLVGTDSKEHIKQEIKDLKPKLDMLAYSKNVLWADDSVKFGSHGVFVAKNKEDIQSRMLQDRRLTEEDFRNGFMHYEETALGGCTSTEPCDSHLTGSLTKCFGCEGADLKIHKIEKTIESQKEFIETLDESSIEFRTEAVELEILEDNLKRMKRSLHE